MAVAFRQALVILLSLTLLTTAPGKTMMLGGVSHELKQAGEEERAIFDGIRPRIASEIKGAFPSSFVDDEGSNIRFLVFKTQVVAGTKYITRITVPTNDDSNDEFYTVAFVHQAWMQSTEIVEGSLVKVDSANSPLT